eukprot:scaffold8421_cov114-Isochrysis_galbana.AAC.10
MEEKCAGGRGHLPLVRKGCKRQPRRKATHASTSTLSLSPLAAAWPVVEAPQLGALPRGDFPYG